MPPSRTCSAHFFVHEQFQNNKNIAGLLKSTKKPEYYDFGWCPSKNEDFSRNKRKVGL
jgi:hypothetical protein